MINLLEPVVAGMIGYFAGERLGVSGYVGAALILASILVVERGTHQRRATGARRAHRPERTASTGSDDAASGAPTRRDPRHP